jgi:hypothetical protein
VSWEVVGKRIIEGCRRGAARAPPLLYLYRTAIVTRDPRHTQRGRAAVGPPSLLGGATRGWFGSYTFAFLSAGATCLLASLLVTRIEVPGRVFGRRRRVDEPSVVPA